MLRWAAFAAVLALVVPRPAEAQFGGWKKKLKEKIAQTIIAQAAGQAAPTPADSTPTTQAAQQPQNPTAPAPAARKNAPAPQAQKGTPEPEAPQAPMTPEQKLKASIFNKATLEMTPDVLDRLEKGLAAEEAERKALAPQFARYPSYEDYGKCVQKRVQTLPEWKKVYDEYNEVLRAAVASNKFDKTDAARKKLDAETERLADPICGLLPEKNQDVRQELVDRPAKAGEKASGMEKYAYAILKERIVPFCSLAEIPAAKGDLVRVPNELGIVSGHYSYAYTKDEVANLRPRCARLLPALKRQ